MRVLIADADTLVRDLIAQVVEEAGMRPFEARSLDEALGALSQESFHQMLVHLAIFQERAGLLEAAARNLQPLMRIVITTSLLSGGMRPHGLGWPVLAKPFDLERMREILRSPSS